MIEHEALVPQTLALLLSMAEEYDSAADGQLSADDAIVDFLHSPDVVELFRAIDEKSALAAPQPDGVVVPRRLLADCRDDVAECMGREYKSHRVKAYQEQLAEIDALLAAAKEQK